MNTPLNFCLIEDNSIISKETTERLAAEKVRITEVMHAKNTDSLKLRKVFSFQAVLSHIHFTDICFLDLTMCN